MSRWRIPLAVGALGAVLAASCAEIGPPPGGEVDKTGPSLLASYPPIGALNVASDNKIILEFSEALVKPNATPAVYISPRPATPPEIKVKGHRIEITLAEFFVPNQTYVVSVASELADARNNRLGTPIAVAFSTGAAIDTGLVSGAVFEAGKPAAQLLVGLYPLTSDSALPQFDSTYPEYTVTTTKDGRFELKYIPDGQYLLVGYRDKSKDERFNPLREQYGLPDRPIMIGGVNNLTDLDIPLTTPDTTAVQVISAAAGDDNLIRIRLSRPVSLALLERRPERFVLVPLARPADTIRALGIREAAQTQSAEVSAWFGALDRGAYRAVFTYDTVRPAVIWDSLSFEPRATTSRPEVADFKPGAGPIFVADVRLALAFSEPIDRTGIGAETFTLWDDADARIPLSSNWPDPFRVTFTPDKLAAGKKYRLLVAETDVKDMDGQTLGDSLRTFEFATLADDSLGSVSGQLRIALSDRDASPVVMTFKSATSAASFSHTLPGMDKGATGRPRSFAVDLPAGKYVLTVLVDQDDDGMRSPGVIAPFRYSETLFTYPDTVIVRARFETAGLSVDVQ